MAERSFKEEVEKLRLGDGAEFQGEGILAVTKALLQSGVSYVAGYQGAPISHLMDVFSDANDLLRIIENVLQRDSLAEAGVHYVLDNDDSSGTRLMRFREEMALNGKVIQSRIFLIDANHDDMLMGAMIYQSGWLDSLARLSNFDRSCSSVTPYNVSRSVISRSLNPTWPVSSRLILDRDARIS